MWRTWAKAVFLFGIFGTFLFLFGCGLFAPGVPQNLSASDGEYLDHVLVTWSSVRGASWYELFQATEEDGEYEKIGETPSTTFTDSAAQPNTLYWYRVRACNAFGCSALSSADSGYWLAQAPPPAPQNVSASDGTFSDRVRVTWTASLGAGSYEIWRSDVQAADYFKIAEAFGTSYDDTTVIRGRTYWYKVKACNQYGCSAFSPADSGQAALNALSAPANVSASDGTFSDRVRVTWSAVPGAARYEVHRATAQAGTYELLAETTATTYDDTTVTVGATYWYKVRAWNVLGYSDFSEPDPGYASAPGGGGGGTQLPSQVPNVSASDGTYSDKIRVTWGSVSGGTSYRVYRSDTGMEGTFSQIAEVPSGTTSYDDTTVTGLCQEYWYAVSAWNAVGEGPLSVPDRGYTGGTLEQVKADKITVTITYSATQAKVKLTWEAVKDADKLGVQYEIWRRVPADVSRKIATTSGLTYEDHQVEIGKTYYYKIRACSEYLCIPCGPFSAERTVVVTCNPAAPGKPTATVSENTVTISWAKVEGASGYQLFRAQSASGPFDYVKDVSQPGDGPVTTTDTPGQGTFYYAVKTCVACGCGGLSAPSDPVTVP